MNLFNRKTTPMQKKTQEIEKKAIIEIETHKDAKQEAVLKAKKASEELNTLLVENGFTLKIYVATGGKYKGK